MTKHAKKRRKFDISEFMVTFLPQILTCVISFLLSLIQIPLGWKIAICIAPWILLCYPITPYLKKRRLMELREIADSREQIMPKQLLVIQKIVESFLSEENRWTRSSYMDVMHEICDKIREFYVGLGKGTIGYEDFSISIKEIQGNGDDLQIREVCRDTSPLSNERVIEFVRNPYPLNRNTPFSKIIQTYKLNKKAHIFIEPNVHDKLDSGDYHCTRSDILGPKRVPYRSVCVSPVLPLYNPNKAKILGFICADAEEPNCFKDNDPTNTIFHECVSGIVYKMMEIQNRLK